MVLVQDAREPASALFILRRLSIFGKRQPWAKSGYLDYLIAGRLCNFTVMQNDDNSTGIMAKSELWNFNHDGDIGNKSRLLEDVNL